jgi:hypothetical protein
MSITGIREQRIYTLLAIVGFFILFNIPKLVINTWDMMQYKRIMACHKFWNNSYFGYSFENLTFTKFGKLILSKSQRITNL